MDKGRRELHEIFLHIESAGQKRLLDSRRPPPIDTGSSAAATSSSSQKTTTNVSSMLQKNFSQFVTNLIISDHLFGGPSDLVGVPVSDIPRLWESEYGSRLQSTCQNIPGIRIGTDTNGVKKCTIAALCTPSAVIASLFNIADTSVWNDGNVRLIELVQRLLVLNQQPLVQPSSQSSALPATAASTSVTANQLSELSSLIFKSIMSSGTDTARECGKALKILAEKDPKSIHQIVAQHLNNLRNCNDKEKAAKCFIDSLVARGRETSSEIAVPPGIGHPKNSLEELKRLIGMHPTKNPPLPAPQIVIPSENGYSKSDLLAVHRMVMESAIPEPLRNLKLSSRRK